MDSKVNKVLLGALLASLSCWLLAIYVVMKGISYVR